MSRGTAQTFNFRWGELAGQGSNTTSSAVGDTGQICLISAASDYSSANFKFALEDPSALMLAIWQTEQGNILDLDLGRSKFFTLTRTLTTTRPAETDIASTFGPGATYGYHIRGLAKVTYVPSEAEHEFRYQGGTLIGSCVGTALSTAMADAMLNISSSMKNIDHYLSTYRSLKVKYGL